MPTLLQINIASNWGSTGKIAEAINLAAQRKGWECSTAYGRWANPSKFPTYKVGNKWDLYVHYFENRIFDREGLSSRKATKALIRHIEELKPDVISLHNIHDHYLNYELLFRYLNETKIKVVWTFHDCWAMTGHCMHFVTKNCDRWKTGCYDCLMKGEYPNSLVDRSRKNWELKKSMFAGCKNLSVVACSDWIANFARESFLKDKRILTIHNGVDLSIFKPQSKTESKRYKIIAVSSPWYPAKGELDIYKLRSILSDEDFEIIMVGLSANQMKKLPAGIRGIQRTQNVNELAKLYSDSDVLINPTYADTFPTVNLEALACGTPVITYRTGGSPEAVDEKTGFVVEQGDVDALADAIRLIKESPLSSEACRKRAEEHFEKDKCFEEYIELYESLLK